MIETLDKQYWLMQMEDLIKESRDISAQWNGDESGTLEDIATEAGEVQELAEKIQAVLNE